MDTVMNERSLFFYPIFHFTTYERTSTQNHAI